MALKSVTAPATKPVSLVEAKLHLNIDFDDHDALLTIYIGAATDAVEKFLGRALIEQTWDLYLDEFPEADEAIQIPLAPTIEIVGVFYVDSNGDEQAFTGFTTDIVSEPARISVTTSWPTPKDTTNAGRIRFRAGYLNSDSPPVANVPAAIKAGILVTLGNLYANRETIVIGQTAVDVPWAAQWMLRRYRLELGMA